MPLPTLRVATAHISPSLLDTPSTLQKTLACIEHASAHKATLVSFPESSIPGFPIWSALLPPSHPSTHAFFARFVEQSIYADGPEINAIRSAAAQHGISVSLGFSEKARYSEGTLWNSNILIDERGDVRLHHRKIVPTFYERLSWGNGDGYGLRTADVAVRPLSEQTKKESSSDDDDDDDDDDDAAAAAAAKAGTIGEQTVKVGALICGENTNPLARYAIMSQGENVHVSTWPAVWPTRMPVEGKQSKGTGKGKGKNYDNVLANRLRAGAHCFEAKCFGVMCAARLSHDNIETLVGMLDEEDVEMRKTFEYALKNTSQAASMVLDPTGAPVIGFTVNEKGEKQEREMLRDEEEVLFADLDLSECVEGKQYHDVVGGYQRFDVFELKVDRTRREPVKFVELKGGP